MKKNKKTSLCNIQRHNPKNNISLETVQNKIIHRVLETKSFLDLQNMDDYIHSLHHPEDIKIENVITNIKELIAFHKNYTEREQTISKISLLVKSVHTRRTGKRKMDTTYYEYTYEIDWESIVRNIILFQ